MSKTLSESAAEILKSSLASAGKEPAQKLPREEEDLGGATETDPAGGEVGKKAAASVGVAPKPVPKGDAKSAMTQAMEEVEAVAESKGEKYDDEEEDDMEEMDEAALAAAKKKMECSCRQACGCGRARGPQSPCRWCSGHGRSCWRRPPCRR